MKNNNENVVMVMENGSKIVKAHAEFGGLIPVFDRSGPVKKVRDLVVGDKLRSGAVVEKIERPYYKYRVTFRSPNRYWQETYHGYQEVMV